MYYWKYIRNLVPESEASDLTRGIILHAGLAALYEGKSIHDAIQVMRDTSIKHMPAQMLKKERDENEAQLEWYGRILTAYYKRVYLTERFQVMAVEVPFITTLGDVCYSCGVGYQHDNSCYAEVECKECGAEVHWLAGRADLVIKDKGVYRVVDHKTTTGAGAGYLKGWSFTFAQLGYTYGIKRTTGFPVTSYKVNVIKMLKTVGTSNERGEPFINQSYTTTNEQFDRMVHNRICLISKIQEHMSIMENISFAKADQFPMYDGTCRWGCAYTPLDWAGDTLHWFDKSDFTLSQFAKRPEDYVDELKH
jgi:predicted nucleic acid-binding Zn ribbon protein